jgi:hypothetical protein
MAQPADPDAHAAWSSAVIVNLALLSGTAFSFVTLPAALGSPVTLLRFLQVGWSCLWLLALLRCARRPRLGFSLLAFALSPVWTLVQFPELGMMRQSAGLSFEPFMRQRVAVLVFAVLAPRQVWVTFTMIGAFAVQVCLEFFIPSFGATHFGPAEPWITLLYFATAMWIAWSRSRHLSRERRLERRLSRATAAARAAQVEQAVLDLANSPLQVIELQLTLLEERRRPVPPEAAPIRRALARLRALNRILSSRDHGGPDGNDDDAARTLASFDAEGVLHEPLP